MNKHRIYNDEKIADIISAYGYKLMQFNTTTNIVATDSEGYKYSLTLSNLRDNKIPHKLMRNPFAIDNIKHYLSLNYPNYELIDDEYLGCKTKMRFICHNHLDKGIQYNTIDNIMNNHHICKYCSYDKMRDDRVLSEEELLSLCKEKNVVYVGRYTYQHESQIQYICEKHRDKGVQEMSLTHFRNSQIPCSYCNISDGELRIRNYLDNHNIEYETEKIFPNCRYIKPLRFDFYLPKYNLIIEYDGKQHFEPVVFWNGQNADKQLELNQIRDNIKTQYCKDNKIDLLRITYKEYDSIEILLSFLI